jgi:hypothetical protein
VSSWLSLAIVGVSRVARYILQILVSITENLEAVGLVVDIGAHDGSSRHSLARF